MNELRILYHGTSVGWLQKTGFALQPVPYGEFPTPKKFIYLADSLQAASWAARDAYEWVISRIKRDRSFLEHFFCEGKFVRPAPYVYTLRLDAYRFIDWQAESLPRNQFADVLKVLCSKRAPQSSALDFVFKQLRTRVERSYWSAWVANTAEECGAYEGDSLEQSMQLLQEAGFPLVRRIEPPESKYGATTEVWALSAPNGTVRPTEVRQLTFRDEELISLLPQELQSTTNL